MTSATTRTTSFGPLDIEYDDRVLEPRAWTLAQAEWAAELLASCPDGPILEICAGAGQIGLAAAALSGRPAVLVDASDPACTFARRNAESAGLADRVDVRHGPMTEALAAAERFALVLADPPYIPSSHTGSFPLDPLTAIDGGHDGLDIARMCLEVGAAHLASGGPLLIQLRDRDQAEELAVGVTRRDEPLFAPVGVEQFGDHGAVLHLVRT